MAANDTLQAPDSGDASLKTRLRRVERAHKIKSFGLILPLLLFLVITFVTPILLLLTLSFRSPEVSDAMPQTAAAIARWDRTGLPDERVIALFVEELKEAKRTRAIGRVAKRLNYDISGFRSLILKTARRLQNLDVPKSQLLGEMAAIDERWARRETWVAIQRAASPITDFYLLAAFDLARDIDGDIHEVPENRAVYKDVMYRTFWIGINVTLLCLALGYPIAYLLANLPTRKSNVLLLLVLIPFYTSLLVRTAAWLVLLQQQGLVNDTAMQLGLFDERLQLVHNRLGVYVAMVHILLPFMVLPIYSVMKGISPEYVRAARSLGAGAFLAFREAYLPQTLPGVAAGSLLVFIQCLGFYVTPALVGGPGDQMVSYFIAYYTNQTVNWGMAAALSVVLLSAVIVLFAVYNRLVGLDRMKLG